MCRCNISCSHEKILKFHPPSGSCFISSNDSEYILVNTVEILICMKCNKIISAYGE